MERVRLPSRSQRSLTVVRPTRAMINSPTHFTLYRERERERERKREMKSKTEIGMAGRETYTAIAMEVHV